MHSKTDLSGNFCSSTACSPCYAFQQDISRGCLCAELREYLLVPNCCRSCRLRRYDCWRSCDEHLGRIPEEGTYPDGGALCIRSFCNRDGAYKNFILYLFLMFFYGIALTAAQTSITTLLQEKSEPAMHGRVFGLFSTMYAGFLPLGMLLFGPLADLVPLQWLMAGSGAALIAIAGIIGVRLKFRNI